MTSLAKTMGAEVSTRSRAHPTSTRSYWPYSATSVGIRSRRSGSPSATTPTAWSPTRHPRAACSRVSRGPAISSSARSAAAGTPTDSTFRAKVPRSVVGVHISPKVGPSHGGARTQLASGSRSRWSSLRTPAGVYWGKLTCPRPEPNPASPALVDTLRGPHSSLWWSRPSRSRAAAAATPRALARLRPRSPRAMAGKAARTATRRFPAQAPARAPAQAPASAPGAAREAALREWTRGPEWTRGAAAPSPPVRMPAAASARPFCPRSARTASSSA